MRKATKTRLTMAAATMGVLALTIPAFAKGGAGGAVGGVGGGGALGGGIKVATTYPGVCTGGDSTASATARMVRNFWQFTNTVTGPSVGRVWHVTAYENDQLLYDTDSDFTGVTTRWSIQDAQVVAGLPGTKSLTWRQVATNTATGEVCSTTITVQSKI